MIYRLKLIGLLVAGLFVAIACSITASRVNDTISFSHHLHTEMGSECADCHGDLFEDKEKRVQAIPGKDGCSDCHDVSDETTCGDCHKNAEESNGWEKRSDSGLFFSHEVHHEIEENCVACHLGADHWVDRSASNRPVMDHGACESCHKDAIDGGKCATCHDRIDLSGQRPEKIQSHGPVCYDRHRAHGQSEHQICANCHDQSYCAECHARNGTVKPSIRYPEKVDQQFIHRGDFISRHAAEARLGRDTCLKCHGTQYCSACHERSGVGPQLLVANPHATDLNWLSSSSGAGAATSNHGREARRRITECAACHDQGAASICVRCHSSGGHNPHPPGWNSKVDGLSGATLQNPRTHPMCSVCHN